MEESLTPEKDKYMTWLEEEKKKGLKSAHVSWTENASAMSSEELYADLNRIREAPVVERPLGSLRF